jgi:ATP-dependent 26S proteasome regulatory subunit
MESYRGLAILTSNLKEALDKAFLRRLRFVVDFPFPREEERLLIWQGVFPATMPTEGLDYAKLARLNVAGGSIRNIAVNAAFLAANDDRPVGMSHILHAARREYAKLARPLTAAEIGDWL